MRLQSNRAFLKDELQRLNERFEQVSDYLNTHPAMSLQKRVINGCTYYYERFKDNGTCTSRFYSKDPEEAKKRRLELEEASALRRRLKAEKQDLKKNITLIERLIKTVNKGLS